MEEQDDEEEISDDFMNWVPFCGPERSKRLGFVVMPSWWFRCILIRIFKGIFGLLEQLLKCVWGTDLT